MPIAPHLKQWYTGPEWEAIRARIFAREGYACKNCGVGQSQIVLRHGGKWAIDGALDLCGPHMTMTWRGPFDGERIETVPTKATRWIYIVLSVAHLDHNPENQADDNLAALCQWCHLRHDRTHHTETRGTRKDTTRPLLTAPHLVGTGEALLSEPTILAARPSQDEEPFL